MKTEDLQAKGLTEEQISYVMGEYGKEADRAKGYKEQLSTANERLKAFDGVDVSQLRGEITRLTNDLTAKENQYKEQLAQRDFDDLVKRCAADFKARDVKAVMPFLDTDALRQSKNQEKDLKAAFETVKKDKPYLFADDKTPRVVSYTQGTKEQTDDNKTKAKNAFRAFFGKG